MGWQGDIAFAVFVENGGGSAAPPSRSAETFLRDARWGSDPLGPAWRQRWALAVMIGWRRSLTPTW